MQIGKAGYLVQLSDDLLGNLMAKLNVVSFKLHIDRGRQTKVEYLGDYIRWQKVEG